MMLFGARHCVVAVTFVEAVDVGRLTRVANSSHFQV